MSLMSSHTSPVGPSPPPMTVSSEYDLEHAHHQAHHNPFHVPHLQQQNAYQPSAMVGDDCSSRTSPPLYFHQQHQLPSTPLYDYGNVNSGYFPSTTHLLSPFYSNTPPYSYSTATYPPPPPPSSLSTTSANALPFCYDTPHPVVDEQQQQHHSPFNIKLEPEDGGALMPGSLVVNGEQLAGEEGEGDERIDHSHTQNSLKRKWEFPVVGASPQCAVNSGGGGGGHNHQNIIVQLLDLEIWKRFNKVNNEMIVTKSGR